MVLWQRPLKHRLLESYICIYIYTYASDGEPPEVSSSLPWPSAPADSPPDQYSRFAPSAGLQPAGLAWTGRVHRRVVAEFGQEVLTDGAIDREKLGDLK